MPRKILLYAVCAAVLAAFSPVLPFQYLAATGVILAGLALLDLLRLGRRR